MKFLTQISDGKLCLITHLYKVKMIVVFILFLF